MIPLEMTKDIMIPAFLGFLGGYAKVFVQDDHNPRNPWDPIQQRMGGEIGVVLKAQMAIN